MKNWHLFKQQKDEMWWLACIEADDAESAVAIYAHEMREAGETNIPIDRETLIHAIEHDEFHLVHAGWFHDPAQLHVNPVTHGSS